jgi:hypothetical protein
VAGHIILKGANRRFLHPCAFEGQELNHGCIRRRAVWAESMLVIAWFSPFKIVACLFPQEEFEASVKFGRDLADYA